MITNLHTIKATIYLIETDILMYQGAYEEGKQALEDRPNPERAKRVQHIKDQIIRLYAHRVNLYMMGNKLEGGFITKAGYFTPSDPLTEVVMEQTYY